MCKISLILFQPSAADSSVPVVEDDVAVQTGSNQEEEEIEEEPEDQPNTTAGTEGGKAEPAEEETNPEPSNGEEIKLLKVSLYHCIDWLTGSD